MSSNHILIFDSGLGGVTVLRDVHARLSHSQLSQCHSRLSPCYSYALDNEWFPYGEKSDASLLQRILTYFELLLEQVRPDLVVIACNTASTLALDSLRQRFAVPFVGVVPAIKPAVQLSRTGTIGLLATPATVKRNYVERLQAEYGNGCRLIKVSCPSLVALAEAKMRGEGVCRHRLEQAVADIRAQDGVDQVDVFVLGCTHFPALRDELAAYWPEQVQWLDSGAAIARRVESLLLAAGELDDGEAEAGVPARLFHTAPFTGEATVTALEAIFSGFGISALEHLRLPSVAAETL
jgi:glutamate racemase